MKEIFLHLCVAGLVDVFELLRIFRIIVVSIIRDDYKQANCFCYEKQKPLDEVDANRLAYD